jgi:transporter family protein
MWIVYALLSAVFAALTSILAKIGIENVNSHLATAVRTIVVLFMSWALVFVTGNHTGIANISRRSLLFLALSGIATGLSWLCYYRALQIGDAAKVIPIDRLSVVIGILLAFVVLKETVTAKTIIGGVLITAGTLALIL